MRFLLRDLPIALALAFFVFAFQANPAAAKDLPSDICSLLAPQALQKTLGQPFSAAEKHTAPPAYAGQPAGTNCAYSGQKSSSLVVTLIVYVDRSASEAKETFDKLSAWFPATSKPSGIGDSAYIDKNHAIHVLKGSVRYFISISSQDSAAAREKQPQDLATSVAARI
ncbi:MAG TPA: hypothetical protein VK770_16530 [Candidatus Acidoferrum sp.]|jgi:hypothetical protein|nr:hypothetical protein [Candidatus Acidoferrum sp.]